jgi:cytochrome c-type biogenesis protein CcmH
VSGWIILIGLAAVTLTALIFLGKLSRRSWEAVAAAIVLAMAGYAFQGRPDLAGAPAVSLAAGSETAATLILIRSEMDQSFSPARPYLILSDAYARDGNFHFAAAYIRSGIKKNPRNADLWSGLGLQLLLAGEGKMSPPAKYAFDQGRKYDPGQPAADYFTGLTALFDGRTDEAMKLWQGLLDNAPKEARWKPRLESQVAGLQQMVSAATSKRANFDKSAQRKLDGEQIAPPAQ